MEDIYISLRRRNNQELLRKCEWEDQSGGGKKEGKEHLRKKGWLRCKKDRDEEEGKSYLDIGSHNEASKKTDTREVTSS